MAVVDEASPNPFDTGWNDRKVGLHRRGSDGNAGPSRNVVLILATALGVVVPLVAMLYVSLHQALSFDGAMNFQVASNIAHGHGFARDYGAHQISPNMLETSGVFLFVAVASVKVLGTSALGVQLPNLLFLALLLILVSYAVKPWPWLRIAGPVVVIVATPGVCDLALGGYGEFPVAALALGSFICLGSVAEGARAPLGLITLGWALIGLAISVKIVGVALLPVALVGTCVIALVRTDVSRLKIVGCAISVAAPLALWELYRMVSLGGTAGWRSYWAGQLHAVSYQAGVSGSRSVPVWHKAADHLHLLGRAIGMSGTRVTVMLAVPFLGFLVAFLVRRCPLRVWLTQPRRLLAALLFAYALTYFAWWIFITPTEKAWLRRIVIGWVALVVGTLLLIGIAVDAARSRRSTERAIRRSVVLWAVPAVITGLLVSAPGQAYAATTITRIEKPPAGGLRDVKAIAQRVKQGARSGEQFCGYDWWSAPLVSLRSGVSFCDLTRINVCSPAWKSALLGNRVLVVWDHYATQLSGPAPTADHRYEYSLVARPSSYGSLWLVKLRPHLCG